MKRLHLGFILISFVVIFSPGARAEVMSNNEVAGFILQNFSDPTVPSGGPG